MRGSDIKDIPNLFLSGDISHYEQCPKLPALGIGKIDRKRDGWREGGGGEVWGRGRG